MTGIVPPQSWRVIGDLPGLDIFIPLPGPRGKAILERLMNPDPAEMDRVREHAAEREAARVAELDVHLARHAALLNAHKSDEMVSAILVAHGPHELTSERGRRWLECHECPPGGDSDGEWQQSWPCPTWTLISDRTAD